MNFQKKLKFAVFCIITLVICSGVISCESSEVSLSASEITAVSEYSTDVIAKLDGLYDKFEQGEAQAEVIADNRDAPYNMAIGYMAEVRVVADDIKATNAPIGAEKIKDIALRSLREWQDGLNEIASKGADDVSLSDPNRFYTAYLDVLIEIPELEKEITKLTP